MQSESERRAAQRRAERARWPGRIIKLGDEGDIDPRDARTPSELVASVWALTLESWSVAGRAMPEYERSTMPGKVLRGEDS